MAEPPADPDRYDEAIRAFRARVPLTDPEFRKLEADQRQRAFWVAGVTQARTVQEVMDSIGRAIENGTTLEEFKAEAGAKLAEAWGGANAPRLETVFRTNVMGAYNGGRTEVFDDPEIRKARPYLRFEAVGDSRTTEICEALDGTVLPADDPFWNTHTPPLHYNCRSIVTPLSPEEAEDEGIAEGPPDTGGAAPDEGFGQPQRPGDAEEPDTEGFDEEIQDILKDRIAEAPAPPPPPPPHPPEYPSVEPNPASGEMDADPVKFQRRKRPLGSSDEVAAYFHKNQPEFKKATDAVMRITGTGHGAETVVVGPTLRPDWIAQYDPGNREIRFLPHIGRHLAAALSTGKIATREQAEAVETMLHELMHAASNPRRQNRFADGSDMGRDMEESTTEILAQHYNRSFATKVLGLKIEPGGESPWGGRAMFAARGGREVVMATPMSYPQEVTGFARMVTFVDKLDLDKMTSEQFDAHVAGRALQAKRRPGLQGDNFRFGMFVRPLLDRYEVRADHPRYAEITRRLTELVAEALQRGMSITQAELADKAQAIAGDRGPTS